MGFLSRIISTTESELGELERFHFLRTPFMTPSLVGSLEGSGVGGGHLLTQGRGGRSVTE